jgi:protein-S-isoprenylcysteine O-methyltransferase Ste14
LGFRSRNISDAALARQTAIAILGRFFSLAVSIAQDHNVVEKGPYRFVRHPSYTGVLITFIGLGLAVQSWGALLVLLALFSVSFGYRMWVEERTLLSALGDDYTSYMKRTKRLIPFLI